MPLNPYQVKAGDKDLLTLAANLGINYDTLKNANPDITSISQGQFINLPTTIQTGPIQDNTAMGFQAAPTGSFIAGDKWTPTINTNMQVPKPPVVPKYHRPAVSTVPNPEQTLGANSFTSGNMYNWKEMVVTQLRNGELPQQLPFGFIDGRLNPDTGKPFTPQDMIDMGYVSDQRIQSWVLKGTNNQTADDVANPQYSYGANDPNRNTPGHYYVDENTSKFLGQIIIVNGKKRRLLADDKTGRLYYGQLPRRRKRGGGGQQITETPRSDAPSTVLNVVLGS